MSATVAVLVLPSDCQIVKFADAPEWTAKALRPESDDEPLTHTMRRQMCRDDHESVLRAAVKSGAITPLNPHSYVPVPEWEHAQLMRAVMTRADFERFAGMVLVRVESSPTPEGGDAEQAPKWTDERRKALREEHAQLVKTRHKSPTKELADKYGVSASRIRELKREDESKEDEAPKVDRWPGLGGSSK
jgi:hypothetical protein